MTPSLQQIYQLTDVSGRIHAGNQLLLGHLEGLTTQVSSMGQQNARPASFKRRWATRAVTMAVLAAVPAITVPALSVGSLAVLAFGVGRNRNQPPRANALMRGWDLMQAHGIVGLPERGLVGLGTWAEHTGRQRLCKIAIGLAIGLGAAAQAVRVPMALTATAALLTDGAAQLVCGLGAAAFGALTERIGEPSPSRQPA